MTSLRTLVGLAVFAMAAAGCYPQTAAAQQAFPEPVEVAGPPSGQMDPQDPYAGQQGQPQQGQYDPQMQGQDDGQGYAQDPNAQDPNQMAPQDPSTQMDPNDPSVAMGDVNDQEIDQTLDGQGSWSDVDGYGRVWRPDATQVGADFTPYETGGSWVDTDGGWAFDTSDSYGWGWLPFHYGRWGWFDGYWGWQPGYHYGSSWVDWRHGGGYVGWRPQGPIGRPGARALPLHDSHWQFAAEGDLARRNIRSHLFTNPAEGLRVTALSHDPGIHGSTQVHAMTLMHSRIAARQAFSNHNGSTNGFRPSSQQPGRAPSQAFRQPQGYRQPSYGPQNGGYRQQAPQSYRQPQQQQQYRAPQAYRQAPQAPAYRQAPTRQQAPTSRMPSSSYRAPTSHGSSGGGSHSSSSYHSSGGSSHSSGGGGGGHSSGGGHHR